MIILLTFATFNGNTFKIFQDKRKSIVMADDGEGLDHIFQINTFNQIIFLPEPCDLRLSGVFCFQNLMEFLVSWISCFKSFKTDNRNLET